MKTQRQDAVRTRNSLLAAAGRIFAEKGYHDTTIAEISERAGTNVAAVNYHFGDKETLYREAWRQSFYDSIRVHPPDGGVAAGAPAEQRLRGQVAALLRRITDDNNRGFLIAHKELASPTGLLEEVMREEVAPLRDRLEAVVREVLGGNDSRERVRFCAISVMSQCVIPAFINMAEKHGRYGEHDSWRVEDIEGYAEHVVAFSLAAMRAARRSARVDKGARKTAPLPGREL